MSTGLSGLPPVRRRRSGDFRHSVSILKPPTDGSLDQHGQKSGSFRKCYFEIPANFVTLGGRQLEHARMLYNEAEFSITIDPIEGIHPRDRVQLDGTERLFHIGYIKNTDEENVEQTLLCTEIR